MGSKERILRLKDETRTKIPDSALNIAKMEAWQALRRNFIGADQKGLSDTQKIIFNII